ncbi:hypothetical protein FOZ63_021593, partial [Perkinsus olseni]
GVVESRDIKILRHSLFDELGRTAHIARATRGGLECLALELEPQLSLLLLAISMDPFLCSTIALESATVKSSFHRFDGARFLNDVGREVSAFLGKSSRELTFNCPSNTVVLPDIWFMFIRRGVLM